MRISLQHFLVRFGLTKLLMAAPQKHYGKWRIRWIDEHGCRQSETHNNFRDAEFALNRHETRVAEVERGLRPALCLTKTFGELCDYYLANHSIHKRRYRDDECLIRVHLRPAFGHLKLIQVADHIDQFKASRVHAHPNTLHHHLTLLISMLRIAHQKRWLLELPMIKKPRVRVFDKDFRYLKTEDEIRRFLIAAEAEGRHVLAAYAVSVYTGIRPGELAGLKKSDVLLDQRLIVIQNSFEGPTKNGEVRYVPILDPLLPILREWLLATPGPLLFPNEAGNMLDSRARLFCEIFHRVLDRAEFPKLSKNGKPQNYIRYYDLRHTFASHWVRNRGELFKLSKILGHKTIQMTMRYAHMQPDAFAEDYGRLGVSSPIASGPATVISISDPQKSAAF